MPNNEYMALNRAQLIFFPPQKGLFEEPHVSQAFVRTERDATNAELEAYMRVKEDIISVVENTVIVGHTLVPLPREVVVEGKGFVIVATWTLWEYGKTVEFRWGEQKAVAMKHKWTFTVRFDDE